MPPRSKDGSPASYVICALTSRSKFHISFPGEASRNPALTRNRRRPYFLAVSRSTWVREWLHRHCRGFAVGARILRFPCVGHCSVFPGQIATSLGKGNDVPASSPAAV